MGIKVLVVDDSATTRAILKEILLSDTSIVLVETAMDAYSARDKIVHHHFDVVCLDVEMPKMDGITFLKKMMRYFPLPTIMVSSHTFKNAETTLEALDSGAVDFVLKPQVDLETCIDEIKEELISKVKSAAQANIAKKVHHHTLKPKVILGKFEEYSKKDIIAIGASTGGVKAISDILTILPKDTPGIVIVQHMPVGFTEQFAKRLNSKCHLEVVEAKNGEKIERGKAIIAPGDKHMVIRKGLGNSYTIEVGIGEKVSGHRPSVDVLFNSVAKYAGGKALGVLLTGMGRDGAQGLVNIKKMGGLTVVQDEASSVVYGMPKVALELNGADVELPLAQISQAIAEIS